MNNAPSTKPTYTYRCKIVKIVDGDTVDVDIHLDAGFNIHFVLKNERIRVHGIDTPEMRSSDERERKYGKLAKKRMEALLPAGSEAILLSHAYDPRDYFGRVLAEFYLTDGRRVNDILLEERLCVPYTRNRSLRLLEHQKNWDYLDSLEATE